MQVSGTASADNGIEEIDNAEIDKMVKRSADSLITVSALSNGVSCSIEIEGFIDKKRIIDNKVILNRKDKPNP